MDLLIMNRDDIAARWENGCLTVIRESKLPLYFAKTQNVEHWLETRAIDYHRANSRLLKKTLRLPITIVTEEIIIGVLKKLNMKIKSKVIVDFILNGYKQIG